MKKAFLYACVALTFAGCDKIKELANINRDLTYSETVTIPSLPGNIDTLPPGGISAYFPGMGIATNSQTYIDEYKTSPNLINHVKLTKLAAVVKEPSGGNFNFVDTLNVYLSAPGLDEKLVAHKYGIAKGLTTIDLDCDTEVNLKEYFLKDTMYIRFGGHFVEVPEPNTKVELNSTFNLFANPLNEQ